MESTTDIKSKKLPNRRVSEMFQESKRRKKEHFDWMRKNIEKFHWLIDAAIIRLGIECFFSEIISLSDVFKGGKCGKGDWDSGGIICLNSRVMARRRPLGRHRGIARFIVGGRYSGGIFIGISEKIPPE